MLRAADGAATEGSTSGYFAHTKRAAVQALAPRQEHRADLVVKIPERARCVEGYVRFAAGQQPRRIVLVDVETRLLLRHTFATQAELVAAVDNWDQMVQP